MSQDLPGTCSCDDGYRGTSCGIPCQGGASTPCYGNGICKEDGSCECYSGYTGDACLYEDREVMLCFFCLLRHRNNMIRSRKLDQQQFSLSLL